MRLEVKQLIVGILAVTLFFTVIGLVGRYDYAEQVCISIPECVYDTIASRIETRSNVDIANEYMANRCYYDSIALNH